MGKVRHWERGLWPRLGRASLLRKHLSGSPREARKVALVGEGSIQGAFWAPARAGGGVGGSEEQPGDHCGQGLGWGQWSLIGGFRAHHPGQGVCSPEKGLRTIPPNTEEQGKGRTTACSAPGAGALPTLCQVENIHRRQVHQVPSAPLGPLISSSLQAHQVGILISPIVRMRN